MKRRDTIGVIFLAVFLVFSGRLVHLQAIEGPRLAEEARQDRLRSWEVQAQRGDIRDTTGELLAHSTQRYNVGVNQRKVATFVHKETVKGEDGGETERVVGTGAAAAADLLAPLLGKDPAELGAQLVGDSTFVYLAKGLTPGQWREIRNLGIPGIEPESVTERVYPNGNTAGNLLGYVGADGHGQAGLEYSFDDELEGVDGAETVEIGAGGQVIPTGTWEVTDAVPGDTLRLTINRDVQYVAQQAVDGSRLQYGAQWAGIAVVEIGTGRVVALADSGTVDPGNVEDTPAESRGARSVSAPYEPGSTGKLLTIAAAVDQGLVDAGSTFTVPDRMTFNGQTFKDPEPHPEQRMTLAGIVAQSSNVGTVQVGNLMDDDVRYQYMRDFGFGQRTGVELPGEEPGLLSSPDTWDGRTRMTTMFGQGYAITLMQNAAMVATIGNGGTYVAPFLVDSIEHPDGSRTVPERAATRDVISPDAAQQMLDMMEGVTRPGQIIDGARQNQGTGWRAGIDGYRVAGKTGTAQTVDGGGGLGAVVANFVGVVPADNPRFAAAVVVYKPSSGFYGGTVAAPIFHDVLEFTLHTHGVAPSQGTAPELAWTRD